MFHVNLLKPVEQNDIPGHNPPPPPAIEIEGDEVYEVNEIIDSKLFGRTLKFLVNWKGYGPEDNTWEPLSNLDGSAQAIKDYQLNHPNKPHASEAQLSKLKGSDNIS